MNEDLKRLYEQLGYTGPTQAADRLSLETTTERAPDSSHTRDHSAPHVSMAAESGIPYSTSDPAEIPPLDLEAIDQLQDQLNENPAETLQRARAVIDESITEEKLRSILSRACMALRSPSTAVDFLGAESIHLEAANRLPVGFTFDGMDLEKIPIDPGDRKFETDADALGWAINAGPFILTKPKKEDFRWHSHPDYSASRFIYDLAEPTESSPLEVVLFSDFGNGRYHAQYIAKQLGTRQYPYAIHLGDVYYAGRRSEFKNYFAEPLDPLLPNTALFALNSNHEMYSAGIPYYEFMDARRHLNPVRQKQEGSYFCLRSTNFQIVGIDTAYFKHGRYKDADLLEWLAKTLDDGKAAGCVNILLSADHPYEYGKVGETSLLRKDLNLLVKTDKLVDLWFWGNTHYCALFDRTTDLPFIGSCIGHAGYPYDRVRLGKPTPAPIKFLETSARFPEWTKVRQDRGNNGYCLMSLKADSTIGLSYIDWMGNVRCEATLSRSGNEGALTVVTTRL